MREYNEANRIPMIEKVDLLIIGGGLRGLPCALSQAKQNKKVLIIEKNTFLGYELGVWQRPWILWNSQYGSIFEKWFPNDGAELYENSRIIPIHLDKFKLKLEDMILKAGVGILYASIPTACKNGPDGWQVTIGNKSGRQVIAAKTLIDTTETCLIARLCERNRVSFFDMKPGCKNSIARRTIEFTGVDIAKLSKKYAVPGVLGIYGDEIQIYPGYFSEDHVFVDIAVELADSYTRSVDNDTKAEYTARKKSIDAAAYMVNNLPEFDMARLGMGSMQVMRRESFDPLEEVAVGIDLSERFDDLSRHGNLCVIASPAEYEEYYANSIDLPENLIYREDSDLKKLYSYPLLEESVVHIAHVDYCDVLVAGGGTSGAVAAAISGREGAKTVLLEMNAGLGGTGTVGGIHSYWYGYRNSFTAEIDSRVRELETKIKFPVAKWRWGDNDAWSMELKALALFDMSMESGVRICFNSITIGALTKDNKVLGALSATPYGVHAIISEITVDATGDGDVAAFAGADFVYGSKRDSMVMLASFAQFGSPAKYKGGVFTSTVDVGNIFDYTRFIIVNRRRGDAGFYEHGTYVTPRESRHILGKYVITLDDQLLMRKYSDTVYHCWSNHDIKGKSAADTTYFGLLPPNLDIHIPYRALLPKHIGGLLIAGKAISCTHDALAAIRMQSDLQQQGGAVGLAAAMCVKDGVLPEKLDVNKLQEKLISLQVISKEDTDFQETEKPDLKRIIEELSGEEPFEWMDMDVLSKAEYVSPIVYILTSGSRTVVPLLKRQFAMATEQKKLVLARLLAWHGDETGLECIINQINCMLDTEHALPKRKGSMKNCRVSPDHGVMTEATYLINVLSRIKSKKTVPVIIRLADMIAQSERDYWDERLCLFGYIHSVAYVAERLCFSEFKKPLQMLLALPELQYTADLGNAEVDIMPERIAMLNICLSRALARCGCRKGLENLADYVEDRRSLLAKCAIGELKTLSGKDFGCNKRQWMEAILSMHEEFKAVPWTERMN